jgi:hypothetical protein
MPKDIISKKTRREFREYMVVDWSLRKIRKEFESVDVPLDRGYVPPISGSRRSLVEKYYHGIDWTKWEDIRKILAVFQYVLGFLESSLKAQDSHGPDSSLPSLDSLVKHLRMETLRTFESLKKWLNQDGFDYVNGKLISVGRGRQLDALAKATEGLDTPGLYQQIERMYEAVDDDPALAIGTAKELIETACKTILEEQGERIDDAWDLGELVRETRKALGLLPEDVPETSRGAETIRKLLGSLGNITQSLGELRNLYGTGHGKHGKAKGLKRRHARLSVGASATLVTFLFETHADKQEAKQ